MLTDITTLTLKSLSYLPYLFKLPAQRISAIHHNWTWHPTPDAKNVVVVGGSFAGIELVKRLAETLPTGCKIIWIEKNSHLNYSFVFPRFSVLPGHEHSAFIPYDGVARGAPAGILTRIQDKAIDITADQVVLVSGQRVDYAVLVIATGSSQPLPVQVMSTDKKAGCAELKEVQATIKESHKVAIVGGGAVGVELASDIKGFYPEKNVTLVHSRGELLNQFGGRLREYALRTLRDELGVRVFLDERVKMPEGGNFATSASLIFADGAEEFDLVIGCTGQRPNSSILGSFLPGAISEKTSRICVRPTLQVFEEGDPESNYPIFAFGDVADHSGPRMARAAWMQAQVVAENVLSVVQGRAPGKAYEPDVFLEGSIKLTLGKKHVVIYAMDANGHELMIPTKYGQLDLGIKRAWWQYGVDFNEAQKLDTATGGSC
ncbi:hypothetical protein OQA88_8726 [Cercophora sp. LCS_1]